MARSRAQLVTASLPAGTAVLSGLVFLVVRTALIDDAYIMLGYAESLAFHLHWGLIEEEFANSATSPLNVLVLGAFTFVLRSAVLALGAVFVLANVTVVYALRQAAASSGLPTWSGVLGMVLLLGNPLLLSAVGLEMTLASALLALLVLASVRVRPVMFGVVSGLLVLTRLDLAVFVVIVFLGRPVLLRRWWKAVLPGVATALPWFLFSWFVFGSAVPDTLVIKQLQESWGKWDFGNGLVLYYQTYPVALTLSVVAAAAALFVLALWPVARVARVRGSHRLDTWILLGIAGLVHYYVYTQMQVPPYHWYYAPGLIALTILFAAGTGALVSFARRSTSTPARAAGVTCGAVLLLTGTGLAVAQGVFIVQRELPWKEAPISTNWATPADYARIGQKLGEIVGEATVSSPGEIGTLAYFCDCAIVDPFSDRGYLAKKIEKRIREAGPFVSRLLELNYTHFEPTEPRPIDYHLRRVPGPGKNPVWNIDSSWTEKGHLVLSPVKD